MQLPLLPNQKKTKAVKRLFEALKSYECRLVGGFVRDMVLDRQSDDIDVATTATPQEAMEKLKQAGIAVHPTGLKHGTITAVVNDFSIEVTTLRKDVQADGRHAQVEFTTSFKEDAARRDFTMNALYMDIDGCITDFYGGLEDLKHGKICFVGNAEDRIKEDYLRILRYFRFMAWYGHKKTEKEILDIIRDHVSGLKKLSAERITTELLKTLTAPDPVSAVQDMEKTGVLNTLGISEPEIESFNNLVKKESNPLVRLMALVPNQGELLENDRLVFSNKQKSFIKNVTKLTDSPLDTELAHRMAYRHGKDIYMAALILMAMRKQDKNLLKAYRETMAFKVPEFPLSGQDLIERGIKPGKKIGVILEKMEEWWLEHDFPPRQTVLYQLDREKKLR